MNDETTQTDVAALNAFAIEMSRDPREGLTARQRALMACIVIPAPIQQWMLDAGVVEPLLDSIEKTILAAEEPLRAEIESKSGQIGKLYKVCNERDVLMNTLKGIAEYCSTDHGTLSAIARLVSIRNTADRAVATYQQSTQPEKSK